MGLIGMGIGMLAGMGADMPSPIWLMATIASCIKRDSIDRQDWCEYGMSSDLIHAERAPQYLSNSFITC